MRNRSVAFAVTPVLLLLWSGPAAAQGAAGSGAAPLSSVASAFPDAAHFAYVDLGRVVALSAAGKSITAKIEEFRSKKGAEVEQRGKQVEALQTQLGSDLLNEPARTQLQREFERARVDFQRFSQDAQSEVQEMQQHMQTAFGEKLFPVIGQIAKEKNLWAVFTATPLVLWTIRRSTYPTKWLSASMLRLLQGSREALLQR